MSECYINVRWITLVFNRRRIIKSGIGNNCLSIYKQIILMIIFKITSYNGWIITIQMYCTRILSCGVVFKAGIWNCYIAIPMNANCTAIKKCKIVQKIAIIDKKVISLQIKSSPFTVYHLNVNLVRIKTLTTCQADCWTVSYIVIHEIAAFNASVITFPQNCSCSWWSRVIFEITIGQWAIISPPGDDSPSKACCFWIDKI